MSDASYVQSFLQVLQNRNPEAWQSRAKEGGYWEVEYKGCVPPCKFYVETGPTLLYLYARLDIKIWYECRLAVYRYALRLNEEMSAAKLGLDPDGRLSLMVEWPGDGLTFASFETAVQVLLNYHRTYYPDIQLVAQDPHLAHQVTARELQEQAAEEAIRASIEKPERKDRE